MENYDHRSIESRWQKFWEDYNLNKIDLDGASKPFYNLMMFPYPSAEGLHIGSVYTFSGIDTYGRFMRMRGYDVFEPFGLDGFGIHSENYAIKIKENIHDVSKRTQKHYYEQLRRTGNMIDWSRKLETYDPKYYRWTQWIFLQLFKAGLAYRKEESVNWCPSCKTVLSDEQVIERKCERCGTEITKRSMNQWFFRITSFTERLLSNLDKIDWAEDVKTGQRNWIGKSEGEEIVFELFSKNEGVLEPLRVFTTAPETLMGCTFLVIAPEHPLIIGEQSKIGNLAEVDAYVKKAKSTSELDRQIAKEKTGVLIKGIIAIHPVTKAELPLYVADYVLSNYGNAAVMAVPAHDERDYAFAHNYSLPVVNVVKTDRDFVGYSEIKLNAAQYTMANSGIFDGLNFMEGRKSIIGYLEKEKKGRTTTLYKLRDWCVSRQRYWGPPIPMIFCKSCLNRNEGYYKEEMPGWWPEENLPVLLPVLKDGNDTLPDGSGKGALSRFPDFYNVVCPHCKEDAIRETDVSDSFVDSSWYFLRYLFTEFDEIPFGGDFENSRSHFLPGISREKLHEAIDRMKKWGPVTSYIGGREHTVLHLLYARFITMALYDMGYINFEEPFTKFYAHGLITKDGAKMSKSKGNVINPDEYFDKFGADSVRMYLRFMGPFDQGGDWSDTGMKGMHRFICKIYNIYQSFLRSEEGQGEMVNTFPFEKSIMKITNDMEQLKFNTCVAEIMKIINWYQKNELKMPYIQRRSVLEELLIILAPFIPHLAEELWFQMTHKTSIHLEKWPKVDETKLYVSEAKIAVQVDGKTRGVVSTLIDAEQEQVLEEIMKIERIAKFVKPGKPKKIIYIKGKVMNIVNS